jgi:hypothetical protein
MQLPVFVHRILSPPGALRSVGEEVTALQPMQEGPPPSGGDKQSGAQTHVEHPELAPHVEEQ